MPGNNDALKEPSSLVEEIEKQLEQVLARKRKQVEEELEERIRKNRDEAKKKIEIIEKELRGEQKELEEYRSTIAEYERNKANLRVVIKNHLDKTCKYQAEIEKLAGATLEELREVRELSEKLSELRLEAEEKTGHLKKKLQEKFGISPEVPRAEVGEEKVEVDLEQELTKLRKIKEILGKHEPVKPVLEVKREPEEVEEMPEERKIATEEKKAEPKEREIEGKKFLTKTKLAVEEVEVPEISDVMDFFPPEELGEEEHSLEKGEAEGKPKEKQKKAQEELAKVRAEEKKKIQEAPAAPEPETILFDLAHKEEMLNILEECRKLEAVEGNGRIYYYQKNSKVVLDGEKIISTIKTRIDRVKKYFLEMPEKESPKDQFFIKQEIINHQELLRKVILRTVKKCERESCSLPAYTAEVLNIQKLRDILEKLSIQNWSNEGEFQSFCSYFDSLNRSFHTKIIPYEPYLKSLIRQLT